MKEINKKSTVRKYTIEIPYPYIYDLVPREPFHQSNNIKNPADIMTMIGVFKRSNLLFLNK